jgi:hypothetical protein
MARHDIVFEVVGEGIRFDLYRSGPLGTGRRRVPGDEWTPGLHPSVSLLKLLLENDAASEMSEGAWVSHATLACMSAAETAVLGLPPQCPHSLRLEANGVVSDPVFRVRESWLARDGGAVIGLRRIGCILESAAERYFVREPLYSALEETERLNAISSVRDTASLDARMVQFSRFRIAITQATGDARADLYLNSITIHHATGLAIEQQAQGKDFFDPILYGDMPPSPLVDLEGGEPVVERQPLLPSEHALKFRSILFPNQGARRHYRLAEGAYVVAAAPIAAALAVVQRVNSSDAETRAAFRADPYSFLIEAIQAAGGIGDILCGDGIVREDMDYGERVLGVREWNGNILSFKIPVYRKWFPDEEDGETEAYTLDLPDGEPPLVVPRAKVAALRDAIEIARAVGHDAVTYDGRKLPLTPDFIDTVVNLTGHLDPPKRQARAAEPKATRKLLVLRAAENAEDLVYNAKLRDPDGTLARTVNEGAMATTPMPHQVDGIAWLRHAFLSGMPGVLLADDMGLGKTFEVLAFLHWLRAAERGHGRPVLLVAPKKLLDTWRNEVTLRLGAGGLGARAVLAYDEHLRRLKLTKSKDGELGRYTLDIEALRAADWVLTTYETLRDYHFSFGKVRFRIAVYDEAQKLKALTSLISNAAKCQQPDFTILMTGTPLENSVLDLWTLLDIAWPGFIGVSAKEFVREYGENAEGAKLDELKRSMVEARDIGGHLCPPIMLRRFKADILEGLPKKEEKTWRETMPPGQSSAYDAVLADQRAGGMPALQALQALRQVAFHPDLRMPASIAEHADMITASARFRSLFRILDGAHERGERVLVFVDLRLGQRVLGELIRHRYRLRRHPNIINGDTATKAVEQIKAEFQKGTGFDVLLLGPRSAGFGLTLTAANHVVHMNRWWNPAVEDQCSDRIYRLGQTRDVTIHLPMALHPALGEASYDSVLNEMLKLKRGLSRNIVVPTAFTEGDFRKMSSSILRGPAPDGVLDRIDVMGWREFEDWTAEQFSRAGYQAHVTPRTGDGGADIILRPPSGKSVRPVICQCKHRALGGQTDETAVRDLVRARSGYGASYPWLQDPILCAVTNGEASLPVRRLSAENAVLVVDRARISDLFAIAKEMLRGAPPVE